MKIISTIAELRAQSRPAGKRRVLVPTMGALHAGHLSLIRLARKSAGAEGEVAVSIFVNPLQFEPGSDLSTYPRPESADEELCRKEGVDLIFRPAPNEMYFEDRSTFVEETTLSERLCGASRPGHFRGVSTVVTKLFHLLTPDAAVFGEKDFQQLAMIRRLVRDLDFAVEIIAGPTVRETDGLALSSRNQYLSAEERAQAPIIRQALLEAAQSSGNERAQDGGDGAGEDRVGPPRPDRLRRDRGSGRPATAPNDRTAFTSGGGGFLRQDAPDR